MRSLAKKKVQFVQTHKVGDGHVDTETTFGLLEPLFHRARMEAHSEVLRSADGSIGGISAGGSSWSRTKLYFGDQFFFLANRWFYFSQKQCQQTLTTRTP